ncbi:hypothetical protein [Lyngbya aestuarii]|uniref:hypothetical protein n=1 Tax=Lyngbya aestuarii TaxID=118322 RepID=UPI00403D8421
MIALTGCNKITPITTAQNLSPSNSSSNIGLDSSLSKKPDTSSPDSTKKEQNRTITANRIGAAKLGVTLGQLKRQLGNQAQFQVKSPYIVDFDAIAVSESDEIQYYILYPAGTTLENSDIIEVLVTDNSAYQTAQGVGPEIPLRQAEAIYGDATLFFSTANESREYINFANLSADISFRPKAAEDGELVGIYPSPLEEYNQTKEYREPAVIGSVEIYCRQRCPSS